MCIRDSSKVFVVAGFKFGVVVNRVLNRLHLLPALTVLFADLPRTQVPEFKQQLHEIRSFGLRVVPDKLRLHRSPEATLYWAIDYFVSAGIFDPLLPHLHLPVANVSPCISD